MSGPRPAKEIDEDQAVRDYVAGASTLAVAAKFGVHHSRIHRIMVRRGVIRGLSESRRLMMSRLSKSGSVIGLAEDLEIEVADLVPLLIKHGFILERRS